MNPRSRLYLDIAGVVSPIRTPRGLDRNAPPTTPPNTGWTWNTSAGGPRSATPVELLADLTLLADRYACEVVLTDTTNSTIAELAEQHGWRTLTHPRVRHGEWPKLAGVQAEQRRAPLPFVWIDDRITPTARRWAATVNLPHLLIRPNRYRGVTPATWATATSFMNTLTVTQ